MSKIIAVDFDGCLCENKFPTIGRANQDAICALKQEKDGGAKVILWTCRCGKQLLEAIEWCRERGLTFDAVNENLPETKAKYGEWGPKVTADEYWDDRAVPVCFNGNSSYRYLGPIKCPW